MSSDTVLYVKYESSTAVWLGNNKGLEKYNGSSGFTYYNISGGRDSVLCIHIDALSNKWIGTNHNGVIRYDNNSFNNMQQLFGTPTGVSWPTQVFSICKGPNGGVMFANRYSKFNTPSIVNSTGSLEVTGAGINIFAGVAPSNLNGTLTYHKLEFDSISNKVFFINLSSTTVNPFLYSFDPLQYSNSTIDKSNSDYLDINNVQTLVTASGDWGWDLQGTKFFIPKGTTSSPLRMGSLWMGGYANGSLHLAGQMYRQSGQDFWPGPLNDMTDTTDAATMQAYNRVWKVNRFDIANFIYNWNAGNVQNGTFTPATSIINWPGNHPFGSYGGLAPFYDYNGDGYYNYHDGDYPFIKGDQMIWWVYNDKGGQHKETGGNALGVEVHGSAYAFVCPTIDDSNRVMNNTVFYNFRVFNYSSNTYDSCYFGTFLETDLGNYQDDYIGCDVMNNYGYTYNGDAYDENNNGITGYNSKLPGFSCNILNGPIAEPNDGIDNNNDGHTDESSQENCLMHSFQYFTMTGDAYTGNPRSNTPLDFYNFMSAKWRNSTIITYGGNGVGFGASPKCRHLFPGLSDPLGISMGGGLPPNFPVTPPGTYGTTGWTQPQANVLKADMRFVQGVGPFKMKPYFLGSSNYYDLDFALVFTQDTVDCNYNGTDTCLTAHVKRDNNHVRYWYNHNNFPSCLSFAGVGIKENSQPDFKVFPNPTHTLLNVELANCQPETVLEISDVSGRVIKGATFLSGSKYLSIPVSDLQPGVYLLKIRSREGSRIEKFIKD